MAGRTAGADDDSARAAGGGDQGVARGDRVGLTGLASASDAASMTAPSSGFATFSPKSGGEGLSRGEFRITPLGMTSRIQPSSPSRLSRYPIIESPSPPRFSAGEKVPTGG